MLRFGESLLGSSLLAPQWEVCPPALQLGQAVKGARISEESLIGALPSLDPGVETVVGEVTAEVYAVLRFLGDPSVATP